MYIHFWGEREGWGGTIYGMHTKLRNATRKDCRVGRGEGNVLKNKICGIINKDPDAFLRIIIIITITTEKMYITAHALLLKENVASHLSSSSFLTYTTTKKKCSGTKHSARRFPVTMATATAHLAIPSWPSPNPSGGGERLRSRPARPSPPRPGHARARRMR